MLGAEGDQPGAGRVGTAPFGVGLPCLSPVARERGAALVSQLKTGQRLVSPEGDVWRWDGFVAAAHAPSGAARRLAERARLVDIENELEQARIDASARRQALEAAEAELQAASAAESAARCVQARSSRVLPRHSRS